MTTPNDAQKREQQEMVKFAASLTAPVEKVDPIPRAAASASADSSGFVDMSAFSVSDPDWVEKALATARGEDAPPEERPRPTETVRGILLPPQTLRPVALSSIDESAGGRRRRRGANALLAAGVGACVAFGVIAIGGASFRRAPDSSASIMVTEAVRGAALATLLAPTIAPPVAPPSTPSTSDVPAASAAAPTPAKTPAKSISPARPKPVVAGAAAPRKAPPRPQAIGGNPSLEEMMRRAAQTPTTKPRK